MEKNEGNEELQSLIVTQTSTDAVSHLFRDVPGIIGRLINVSDVVQSSIQQV